MSIKQEVTYEHLNNIVDMTIDDIRKFEYKSTMYLLEKIVEDRAVIELRKKELQDKLNFLINKVKIKMKIKQRRI